MRGFYTVAREPGKESAASEPAGDADLEGDEEGSGGTLNTIPELMRRVVAAGLSGFFLTEEAIRKALGDTLPKDWTEFAVDQSERTRSEFLDRLSLEIERSMEGIDVAAVLEQLLEDSTIEVNAEIRIKPRKKRSGSKAKIAAKKG